MQVHTNTHIQPSSLIILWHLWFWASLPLEAASVYLLILTPYPATCSLLFKYPQCLYSWIGLLRLSATWVMHQLWSWPCTPPLPAEFTRVFLLNPFTTPSPSWEKAMEKVGEVCEVRIVKKRAEAGPRWNDDLEEVYFQYSFISPSDPFPFFGAPHPVFSYYSLLPQQTPESPSLSSQDSKFYVMAMSNSSLQLDLLVLCSLLKSSLIANSRGIYVKGW